MHIEKLEDRIKKTGLTERIRFLGEIPSQDLPDLLKGCKALVALPRYEGYGLTPLEGMACGLPIVASKTGYFEEFLNVSNEEKACGKIVPIDDYQSASKEILNLLTDIISSRNFLKTLLYSQQKTIVFYKKLKL